MISFPFDGIPLTCFRPVSKETVCNLVLKSPTRSCALGPIPTGLLKACIDSLVPLINRVVNESLESGPVCGVFKQAVVTPLSKKPNLDSDMLKNYRPVSNLPFISKIIEKAVLTQLQEHLGGNGLLSFCIQERIQHRNSTACCH